MKGESLYAVWREEMEKLGSRSTPSWHLLGEDAQKSWNELARFIESLIIKGAGVRP